MDMDDEFSKEIVFALACAGFSAQRHEYDSVREVVYEQVKLLTGVLRMPLQTACAFVEKPEPPEEGYLNAAWIGTAEHIFRVDLSNRDFQSTTGFRAEILRPTEITDLALTATKWYGETPSSDSTLTTEFSVRGRRFKLVARMQNCEPLQKLLRIILTAAPNPTEA
jgi:hypothetical protein